MRLATNCGRISNLDEDPDHEQTFSRPVSVRGAALRCLFTFFLMTIYRYRMQSFSYSSLSSQFLENKHHFWAVVPFHYGILVVTAGHFIAFLIPRTILAWNSHPLRLYVLEISALAFGLLTLIGLDRHRRAAVLQHEDPHGDDADRLDSVCHAAGADGQRRVASPCSIRGVRRGSQRIMSPYLWSIFKLNPDVSYVAAMPHLVKLHIVLAFLTIGFFPVHATGSRPGDSQPLPVAEAQVVRWYGRS